MDPKSNGTQDSNVEKKDEIGEGNYGATRRYNAGLAQSVKKGNADELAEKAKEALEGPEGDELREAEDQAKHGEHGAHKNVPK